MLLTLLFYEHAIIRSFPTSAIVWWKVEMFRFLCVPSKEPTLQQQQEQEHPNKRQCFSSISISTDDDDAAGRLCPYQAEQWFEK
jgi:hypothetical protein